MEANTKQNKYKIFDFLSEDLKTKLTAMLMSFKKDKRDYFLAKIDKEEKDIRKVLVEIALQKDPSLLDEMKGLSHKVTLKSNSAIEEKEKLADLEDLDKKLNEL